jgi:hypothetical protein
LREEHELLLARAFHIGLFSMRAHLILRAVAASLLAGAAAAQTVTWNPDPSQVVLDPGEIQKFIATVCLPGQVGKADIYLLADTTTSMTPVLDSVKANAVVLVDALVNTPGVDLRVGVGNYRDFPFDAKPFDHQVSPTTDATDIVAAINTWFAGGGGDGSEGQLYALYRIAVDPAIGFRPDAKRIIVWFGDSPGHDPICALFNGLGVPTFDLTEQLVTDALVQNGPLGGTTVIAIGTTSSASVYPFSLNDDPNKSVFDYYAPPLVDFCAPTGQPGQADRIATATSGISTVIVDPSTITATILQTLANVLIAADVGCEASPALLPFVTSIDPPLYDDLPLPHDPSSQVCVDFTIEMQGPPCGKAFQASGDLTVTLNGLALDAKPVKVLQPACFNALGLLWAGPRRLQPPLLLPFGDPLDVCQVMVQYALPLPLGELPIFHIPDMPEFTGYQLFVQCAINDPQNFPDDPIKVSNGLQITFGDPGSGVPFGVNSGMSLTLRHPALLGGTLALDCVLN